MWIMATRKDRSKFVLWDSVCKKTGASGLLIVQKDMNNIRCVACTLVIEGVLANSSIDSDCGRSDENGADLTSGSLACLCAGLGWW